MMISDYDCCWYACLPGSYHALSSSASSTLKLEDGLQNYTRPLTTLFSVPLQAPTSSGPGQPVGCETEARDFWVWAWVPWGWPWNWTSLSNLSETCYFRVSIWISIFACCELVTSGGILRWTERRGSIIPTFHKFDQWVCYPSWCEAGRQANILWANLQLSDSFTT